MRPAPPEPPPLSLHDALPILTWRAARTSFAAASSRRSATTRRRSRSTRLRASLSSTVRFRTTRTVELSDRSEEHTSELQSQSNLVCRLPLDKKNRRATQADEI